jgi:hypothetical protein
MCYTTVLPSCRKVKTCWRPIPHENILLLPTDVFVVCVRVCMCVLVCNTQTLQWQLETCPTLYSRTLFCLAEILSKFPRRVCCAPAQRPRFCLSIPFPHQSMCSQYSPLDCYALPFLIHCSDAVCTRSGLLVLHRRLLFLRLNHGRDDGSRNYL